MKQIRESVVEPRARLHEHRKIEDIVGDCAQIEFLQIHQLTEVSTNVLVRECYVHLQLDCILTADDSS
jgi:hypothetical protein